MRGPSCSRQGTACRDLACRAVQSSSKIAAIRREKGGNDMSSNISRRGIRTRQGRAALIKASSCGASALSLAVLTILHTAPAMSADATAEAAVEDQGLTEI